MKLNVLNPIEDATNLLSEAINIVETNMTRRRHHLISNAKLTIFVDAFTIVPGGVLLINL